MQQQTGPAMTYPPEKRQQFVEIYGQTRHMGRAAEAAGITLTTAGEWMRKDPDFKKGVMEVRMRIGAAIEGKLIDHVLNGVPEVVTFKGQVMLDENEKPVTIRRFSDKLMLAAAAQYSGWTGDAPRGETPQKEVLLVGPDGKVLSLEALLGASFTRTDPVRTLKVEEAPPAGEAGGNGKVDSGDQPERDGSDGGGE